MRIFQAAVRFVKMIVLIFLLMIRMDVISGLKDEFSSYDRSAFVFLHSCLKNKKRDSRLFHPFLHVQAQLLTCTKIALILAR